MGSVLYWFYKVVNFADDVALEATDDVAFGFAFSRSPSDVVQSGLVILYAHDHGAIDGSVELAVSTMVDPISAAVHT